MLLTHSSVIFRLFGALLIISFCDFQFIHNHFRFLKTVKGKGYFNLFLASMFLVGSSGVWGWLMFGCFAFFGLFFIAVGCAWISGYDDADLKKDEVAANAKNSLKKKDTSDSAGETNTDNS